MTKMLVRPNSSTAQPLPLLHATLSFRPCLPQVGRAIAAVASARGCSPSLAADRTQDLLVDVLIANRSMLVNMARGFVGCTSRAEDVVHDVFIKLVDFPNQSAVRQPGAYVSRMVRNASIDACRRQRLENTYYADEDDGLNVPSPEPTPEEALLVRDTLRHVYKALAQLSARTRMAFVRVRLCKETLQSTAHALNVSQTLVHFMVRNAEKHCAERLHAYNRSVTGPPSRHR